MTEPPIANPEEEPHNRVSVDSTIKDVWEELQREYAEMQTACSPGEEVGVTAMLYSGQEIHVDSFDCRYPDILIVKGKSKDQEVTAYIAQTSVQIVFQKLKKETEKPRNPIGFIPRLKA